jgi:rhodanese-related sulfurtransferase
MPRVIGLEELDRLRDLGVPLLDVLPEESFRRQHIPGAANAPLDADDFADQVRAVAPDRTAPLIVYCLDPQCEASPMAAHVLEDHLGYEDVLLFEGGLVAWRRAGRSYEGSGPERRPMRDLGAAA